MFSELRYHFPRARVAGVDLSPEVVERNRQRVTDIDFDVLDIQESALGRCFDAILCSEVVEHLVARPQAFVHLARMLAPGGHLLVTTPTGRVYETERRFGLPPTRRPPGLRTLAAANGLQVISIRNWGWPLYKAPEMGNEPRYRVGPPEVRQRQLLPRREAAVPCLILGRFPESPLGARRMSTASPSCARADRHRPAVLLSEREGPSTFTDHRPPTIDHPPDKRCAAWPDMSGTTGKRPIAGSSCG